MPVQIRAVLVHLLLRVNVLEKLGVVPPILVRLDHDCVGLDLFDQLLRSLCEHRRLVGSPDQVDILPIEALRQVDKRGLEARLPSTFFT